MPPSNMVSFHPRYGRLIVGMPMYPGPPLSEVKMTMVFSSRPFCCSACMILSHTAVKGLDHGRVDPQFVVFYMAKGIIISLGRLQGRVHPPMGQIEKKGPVLIGLDHLDGLIGPIVGEIAAWLESVSAVEAGRKTPYSPEESIDGVKIKFGIDNVGVILRKIEHIVHVQTFIKALGFRT